MNQKVFKAQEIPGQDPTAGALIESPAWNSCASERGLNWIKWSPSTSRISLPANAIHLWLIQLDHVQDPSFLNFEILSHQEIGTYHNFHFDRDRKRYLISHCALRTILAGYLGMAPSQIQYQYSARGKPSLIGSPGVYFNLAHSHEIALVAVAAHEEIGVDVEFIRPVEDIDRLARSCFSPREYQEFTQTPASACQRAFFNGWTRKEAYIKATGEGLSHPLDQFDVSLLPGETPILTSIAGHPNEVNQWTLQDISLGDDYAASVALKARPVNIRFWSIFKQ